MSNVQFEVLFLVRTVAHQRSILLRNAHLICSSSPRCQPINQLNYRPRVSIDEDLIQSRRENALSYYCTYFESDAPLTAATSLCVHSR